MNFSIGYLMAGFIFGILGIYIFRQGKREANFKRITLGIALMVYPYFVDNEWLVWGIGLTLAISNYTVRWLD